MMSSDLCESATRPSAFWERINANTIRVFLNVPKKHPIQGLVPKKLAKRDFPDSVLLHKRDDGELYVDGDKIVLHLTKSQKRGLGRGHTVRRQINLERALHPNIALALYENTHLLPDSWKVGENDPIRYICFWAVIYRKHDGCLFVRCLHWSHDHERWRWDYRWLGHAFDAREPAALTEGLPKVIETLIAPSP